MTNYTTHKKILISSKTHVDLSGFALDNFTTDTSALEEHNRWDDLCTQINRIQYENQLH